jgi:hypothetical protein
MIAEIFRIGLHTRKYGAPPAAIHHCKRAGRHINRTKTAVLQANEKLRAIASILLRMGRVGKRRHFRKSPIQRLAALVRCGLFCCGIGYAAGLPPGRMLLASMKEAKLCRV